MSSIDKYRFKGSTDGDVGSFAGQSILGTS